MATYRNLTSGVEALQQTGNELSVLVREAAQELDLLKSDIDNIDHDIQSLLLFFLVILF
jgi:hypothetical protein